MSRLKVSAEYEARKTSPDLVLAVAKQFLIDSGYPESVGRLSIKQAQPDSYTEVTAEYLCLMREADDLPMRKVDFYQQQLEGFNALLKTELPMPVDTHISAIASAEMYAGMVANCPEIVARP